MFHRILVGYVDTEQGRDALRLGHILAQANRAEMTTATAPESDGANLAELASARSADLIVVGSTHRGAIGSVVPGATVERLLGEAPCAVAVAPRGFSSTGPNKRWRPLDGDLEDAGMRVVGVGYDATPAAAEALRTAVEVAVPNGAALRVYTAAPFYPHVPGTDGEKLDAGGTSESERLRMALEQAVAELPSAARALPVFRRGIPETELLAAAQIGIDLLVLGSRAGGPVRRKFHHSVTSTVLRAAVCPLLICPAGVAAPNPASGAAGTST